MEQNKSTGRSTKRETDIMMRVVARFPFFYHSGTRSTIKLISQSFRIRRSIEINSIGLIENAQIDFNLHVNERACWFNCIYLLMSKTSLSFAHTNNVNLCLLLVFFFFKISESLLFNGYGWIEQL